MSENQDELKVQIKAWLKQQNISRNDFAAECFVSPNTVRNWLAKVAIPKDKEALIRLMMEKTEREKKLKEAARANWKPFVVMLSSEDYKLIEEAARRDNMTVEEWAEATLIKDAQKRMKNYYDDEGSLPEDVSLAAEVPEEYGAPRRSGPSSSPPSLPAASRGNKSWRAWHPADVPPACRLPPACCSVEGFPRRRERRSPLLCAESTFLLLAVLQKFYFR